VESFSPQKGAAVSTLALTSGNSDTQLPDAKTDPVLIERRQRSHDESDDKGKAAETPRPLRVTMSYSAADIGIKPTVPLRILIRSQLP
jgi:hypothetical protein